MVALALVIASLVVRYRRASGIERQQLSWFAAIGVVAAFAFSVATLASAFPPGSSPWDVVATVAWLSALGGTSLLPIAIGMAILRYRLYEIDRLISRTIG